MLPVLISGRSVNSITLPSFSNLAVSAAYTVMQEGSVVERGSHHDLMQLRGLYSEMWNRQAESSRQGLSASPSAESLVSKA